MQTVLVAIDDPVISMRLGEELLEQGYSTRTVSDLWTLVQNIKKSRWDLILVDEFFAGRRGLDVCLEFRKDLLESQVLVWASWISVLGRAKNRFPANFHVVKTHTLQELTREICRRTKQLAAKPVREKPLVRQSLLGD